MIIIERVSWSIAAAPESPRRLLAVRLLSATRCRWLDFASESGIEADASTKKLMGRSLIGREHPGIGK